MRVLADNKKAYHNFAVLEKFEAGIALQGTEVKSCRARNISLSEAYAKVVDGRLLLLESHIAVFSHGNRYNHDPKRARTLLMHKREIRKLQQALATQGLTLVPLKFYLNERNQVKLELGLCRGKHTHDKRDTLRKKEHERETRRALGRG